MNNSQKRFLIYGLILLLMVIVACGGARLPTEDIKPLNATPQVSQVEQTPLETTEQTQPTQVHSFEGEPQTGQEVLDRIGQAITNVNSIYAKAQFQLSTSNQPVLGIIEGWGERPDKMHIEIVQSENEDLQGVSISTDNIAGWIFSPYQNTFYFSKNYPGNPHLAKQPELHEIARYAKNVWENETLGEDVEATLIGPEQINGHDTYKVEVLLKEGALDPEKISLENVKLTLWADKQSYLLWQIKIEANFDETNGQGTLTVLDMKPSDPIAPDTFAFEPPVGGAVVVDLDAQSLPAEVIELVSDTP
jgi:outer membrane lipoprotein-sorting protein